VAHLFDNAHEEAGDLQPLAPRRRRWVPIAVAAALALFGSASALLWNTWGGGFPALPSFLPSFTSSATPGAAPAGTPDKPVALKDFQAFQQQIAATAQSTAQLVAAQQAEIKRLSDQVAALAAKIDTLQPPAATAQAAAPVPPPAAPAARKRPAAAKLPPGISTGGAPLPLTAR
jgi:cell division protein FtsB